MILLYLTLAYLIASIPFGLVVAKIFSNKDLRNEGSNNIGATNVARIVGKKWAMLVFCLDSFKGYIPVALIPFFFKDQSNISIITAITALIAVCGHIFSVYLKFKGGKGVATTIGILCAIDIKIGIFFIIIWLLMFAIKKTSSLSALTATLLMPFFTIYVQQSSIEVIVILIIISLLIFIKHKENIKRLIGGSEK